MVDTTLVLPRARRAVAVDTEFVVITVTLIGVLAVGLATAGDYALSVDEFNTDDYGPKALAWYTSAFTDRSHFDTVEAPLWLYGPWFQMLVGFAQSLGFGDAVTIRHAMTFSLGLAGLAAVVPIARLVIGRWAGAIALSLCLLTGYVYGNLFVATIDVPFLFAMSWATLAIIMMARASAQAPAWSATMMAGLFMGLALTTRTGGVITHVYLAGALGLAALDALLRQGAAAWPLLRRSALHAGAAVVLAWIVAVALWPWLQLGNPLRQFAHAHAHFATIATSFEFANWGMATRTDAVPWWYIGGQLLVRLPEGFLALLAIALAFGTAAGLGWSRTAFVAWRRHGVGGLRRPLMALAETRGMLVITVAAVAPLVIVVATGSTLYDGVRHVLFTLPMLALLAAWGAIRLWPLLRRIPIITGFAAAIHATALAATLVILHPLEYTAMNAVAGGVAGARGRFELDYWSLAVAPALRRLEAMTDGDPRFRQRPPRVMVCIGWREQMAGILFRRPWLLETDPKKADYLIATERSPCGRGTGAVLVDTVERFGVPFGWIYANNRGNQN
ncbi:hypothetical protein RA307_17165 [Xanthobacteraceae bacterium Astr-EGSB]|uniref:hypothetical protein n=1 Tax=Astrobacterium formosum TaxID=3069710 RepID=UPI0027B2FFAA|nr:hypothetical protein [Xanthobacteraceae bacterium Astr-EGSB]